MAIAPFTIIFSFVFSSYEVIKKYCPETHTGEKSFTLLHHPLYVIITMFINSLSGTLGSFVGTLLLTDNLNVNHDEKVSTFFFAISLICFLNNIVMYFSLDLVGSDSGIAAIHKASAYLWSLVNANEPAPFLRDSEVQASGQQMRHVELPASRVWTDPLSSQNYQKIIGVYQKNDSQHSALCDLTRAANAV